MTPSLRHGACTRTVIRMQTHQAEGGPYPATVWRPADALNLKANAVGHLSTCWHWRAQRREDSAPLGLKARANPANASQHTCATHTRYANGLLEGSRSLIHTETGARHSGRRTRQRSAEDAGSQIGERQRLQLGYWDKAWPSLQAPGRTGSPAPAAAQPEQLLRRAEAAAGQLLSLRSLRHAAEERPQARAQRPAARRHPHTRSGLSEGASQRLAAQARAQHNGGQRGTLFCKEQGDGIRRPSGWPLPQLTGGCAPNQAALVNEDESPKDGDGRPGTPWPTASGGVADASAARECFPALCGVSPSRPRQIQCGLPDLFGHARRVVHHLHLEHGGDLLAQQRRRHVAVSFRSGCGGSTGKHAKVAHEGGGGEPCCLRHAAWEVATRLAWQGGRVSSALGRGRTCRARMRRYRHRLTRRNRVLSSPESAGPGSVRPVAPDLICHATRDAADTRAHGRCANAARYNWPSLSDVAPSCLTNLAKVGAEPNLAKVGPDSSEIRLTWAKISPSLAMSDRIWT